MTEPLSIEARGEREIVMTRRFAAPRQLVFDAWTKPALLMRWFGGPREWRLTGCEIDLRVGGAYRFVTTRDDGKQMGWGGLYRGNRRAGAAGVHRGVRRQMVSRRGGCHAAFQRGCGPNDADHDHRTRLPRGARRCVALADGEGGGRELPQAGRIPGVPARVIAASAAWKAKYNQLLERLVCDFDSSRAALLVSTQRCLPSSVSFLARKAGQKGSMP